MTPRQGGVSGGKNSSRILIVVGDAPGKFNRPFWRTWCLMNRLGFRLRFVQKARPLKKIPETDAIFTHLDHLHDTIESDPTVLRISLDTKAKVAVGPYCRHGRCRSRTPVKAADHDLHPEAKLVPLGILKVDSGQLFLSLGQSAETSGFIADGIEDWWLARRETHLGVRKIVIDLDNGPNVQSRRTQFMKRLIEFSDKHPVELELAYYPPYHSKYNPVERCWSSLERHWNGTLLVDVVCNAPQHFRDGAL